MTLLGTIIVLAIFYGSGAIVCHTAETGTCRDSDKTEIIDHG